MVKFRFVFAIVVCGIMSFVLFCSNETDMNPTSVFDKAGLYGVLVDKNGSGLSRASVHIYLSDTTTKIGSKKTKFSQDTVFTDKNGLYEVDSLDPGTYVIESSYNDGELVGLIPSITYSGNNTAHEIPTDTLREPGKIAGSVETHSFDNGRVLCYIPGTSFIALSDDTGAFTISNIPQGTYIVKYLRDGYSVVSDSGVVVQPNQKTILAQKELFADPEALPPTPAGLIYSYDTTAGRVSLVWNSVKVSDLAGYIVYVRNSSDSLLSTTNLIKGTACTLSVIDFVDKYDSVIISYQVKSQDNDGNVSSLYSKQVKMVLVNPRFATTVIGFTKTGAINDTASIYDSVKVIAEYNNPARKNTSVKWFLGNTDSLIKELYVSAKSGRDSLIVSSDSGRVLKVFVLVKDESGDEWLDSTNIVFVKDVPTIIARQDTTSTIHDTISFSCSIKQKFGNIISVMWDYEGDGIFNDTLNTLLNQRYCFDKSGEYASIVKVIDDDHNVAIDTCKIKVMNPPPITDSLKYDTIVSINDSIVFTIYAHDNEGWIKKYSWDINGDGVFEYMSDSNFIKTAYSSDGKKTVLVRVVDDDSAFSQDTAYLHVLQDVPIVDAGIDTTINIHTPIKFIGKVFQKFGTIIVYKWDFDGDGTWDDSSNILKTYNYTFNHESKYNSILYVRDDDGNEVKDTCKVSIINNHPSIISILHDTTVSIYDSILFVVNAKDDDGAISKYEWDLNGDGDFEHVGDSNYFKTAYNSGGKKVVIVKVIDDDSAFSLDTVYLYVLQDIPVIDAGRDTAINIHTSLEFTGKVFQKFGTIIVYKWDFNGDGTWDDSSNILKTFNYTFNHESKYNSILYVRDDDGNEVKDTCIVTIVNKPPIILSIRRDTTVSIYDSISFVANALDDDGSISKYEWDFNEDGQYEFSSALSSTKYAFSTAGNYKSVLKVTDDDGKPVFDTINIIVLQDVPIVNAGPDRRASRNSVFTLIGSVTQQFGMFTILEWQIGAGTPFISVQTGLYSFTLPDRCSNIPCVFRVTDDDGNIGLDTLHIQTFTTISSHTLAIDETWNKANSPFYVSGRIEIPIGTSLTIEQGVSVEFDSLNGSISVIGGFNAIGSNTDSIYFKNLKLDYVTAQKSYNEDGTFKTGNRLEYCIIQGLLPGGT